jgi:hypothetical protein
VQTSTRVQTSTEPFWFLVCSRWAVIRDQEPRGEGRSPVQTGTSTSLSLRERVGLTFQQYLSTIGVRGCPGTTTSPILTSSRSERPRFESSKDGVVSERTVTEHTAQTPHPNRRKVLLTQQSCPLPEGEGLEFGRYADVLGTLDVQRGEPSPSGRGQGEGLDVDSSSAVIGRGAKSVASVRSVLKWSRMRRRISPSVVPSFHPPKLRFTQPMPDDRSAVKCSTYEKRSRAIGRASYLRNGWSSPLRSQSQLRKMLRSTPHPALSRRERVDHTHLLLPRTCA